ncbi:hypothetical protein LRY65_03705 [Candidatus Woesebacteria bacterium]|nr:hypothetical protein [Candidatus Woesebacteria bacterium]MCD8527288.1 hypothetical protein [Candidatus Woesebacteria bacterium]MCD8546655.1 hypothetical protein [Candidatus Woesebacteria bacterium]
MKLVIHNPFRKHSTKVQDDSTDDSKKMPLTLKEKLPQTSQQVNVENPDIDTF